MSATMQCKYIGKISPYIPQYSLNPLIRALKVLKVAVILSIRLMASHQNIVINCATQQSSECLG